MAAPQDWIDEQGVLHKYDKSQYNSQPSQSAGGKDTTEKPKVEVLRYPYNLKIDRDTDYLELSIGKYSPSENFKNLPSISVAQDKNSTSFSEKDAEGKDSAITNTTSTIARFADLGSASIKDIHTYISLPIPQSISDTNDVSWGPDTMDPLSAFAVSLGGNLIGSNFDLQRVGAALIQNAKDIKMDESTKNAVIAAISGKAYGALGGNVSISNLISRASGQVFNPNLELLFNGVNLRSFPFTFDFAPRNQSEARIVKKIIRSFKKAMTAKGSAKTQTGGIFISAPDIFKLTYKRGKDPHPFLNKFKPMALTNMQLNYTGSNTYATYADGTPVHIQVTLSFTELNPIYNEDYNDETDIGVGF